MNPPVKLEPSDSSVPQDAPKSKPKIKPALTKDLKKTPNPSTSGVTKTTTTETRVAKKLAPGRKPRTVHIGDVFVNGDITVVITGLGSSENYESSVFPSYLYKAFVVEGIIHSNGKTFDSVIELGTQELWQTHWKLAKKW
jgi:hypothetical protein